MNVYSEGESIPLFQLFNVQKPFVSDYNQDRLYWMEDSSGGLKSSNFDGTNVITVFTTNKTSTNYGIDVHGSNVYCANYNRLLNVTVSPAIKANAIYTDTEEIVAVLFFNEKRTYITHV